MVPIVDRASYTSQIRENIKVDRFFGLLFNIDSEVKEQTEFNQLIDSIKTDHKGKFQVIYETLIEREPSQEAPFVNDNYLLFLLILGCQKYGFQSKWITKVLDTRNPTTEEAKLISTTYKNLINRNYTSKVNDFGIIISFEVLSNKKNISWEEKKLFYQSITNRKFPFYSDDLLNLLALKAYDSVVLQGDKSRESKYNSLLNFESKFISRVNFYSHLLQWVIIVFLIGIFIYSYSTKSWFKNLVDTNIKFAALFGIGGVLVTFFLRGKLRDIIKRLLHHLFGYKVKTQQPPTTK